MFIPAWQVFSLPPARSAVAEWSTSVCSLRNLDTTVIADPAEDGLRNGQVMWGTQLQSQVACIAWDWREVQHGVMAICDPMAVHSNIVLVNDDDEPIPASQLLLYLNRAIHTLPWQDQIGSLWLGRRALALAA